MCTILANPTTTIHPSTERNMLAISRTFNEHEAFHMFGRFTQFHSYCEIPPSPTLNQMENHLQNWETTNDAFYAWSERCYNIAIILNPDQDRPIHDRCLIK